MAGLHGNISRRRRQNALDGSVPGVHYKRFIRGSHPAGTATPADLTQRFVRIDLPHQSEEYDPVRAEYATSPGYDTPDPWDAISLEHLTPRLLLDPPDLSRPLEPRSPSYRNSLAFSRLVDAVVHEVRDLREAGEPVPEKLAELYETVMGPGAHSVELHVGGFAGPMGAMDVHRTTTNPLPDPALDELAIQMTSLPAVEMAIDGLLEAPVPGYEAATPGTHIDAMPLGVSYLTEEAGPSAEPSLVQEAPMMDAPGQAGDAQPMTLEALVEQMMPESAPPPEMPDPFMLMQLQFNQQMQMMDPFAPPGPMM